MPGNGFLLKASVSLAHLCSRILTCHFTKQLCIDFQTTSCTHGKFPHTLHCHKQCKKLAITISFNNLSQEYVYMDSHFTFFFGIHSLCSRQGRSILFFKRWWFTSLGHIQWNVVESVWRNPFWFTFLKPRHTDHNV